MPSNLLVGARLARAQRPSVRRGLRAGFAALLLLVTAHAVMTLSGLATTSALAVRATDLLFVAVGLVAMGLIGFRAHQVDAERAAWWCLAASTALFALGNVLWGVLYLKLEEPPYPNVADAAWTLYHLPTYAGIVLLVRTRLDRLPRAVALDGVISFLGLAALVTGLVLGPVLAATGGAALTVTVNVVYPIGDLVLLMLSSRRGRVRRARAWRSRDG